MAAIADKSVRDPLVDCLKGYACLLVVFGHIIMGLRIAETVRLPTFSVPLETAIWSFHVSLFMFLSGYVYRITGEWRRRNSRWRFVGYKLLNLGVPYVLFSVIYIGINCVIPNTNHKNQISDILRLWKTPVAHYWFLYALFILFVLWTVLSIFLKNWQITVLLVAISYGLSFIPGAEAYLWCGYEYVFAFGLGTIHPKLFIDHISLPKRLILIGFHLVFIYFLIRTNLTGKPIIKEVEAVVGIAASVALISMLVQIQAVERFLLFISRYAFPIYLLHTIFTAGIRILLSHVGVGYYWVHVVLALPVGIGAPILIGWIASKRPILNGIFYPSKRLDQMRKVRKH